MTPKVKLDIINPDEAIHQRGGQKWLNLKNNVKKSLNSNKSKAGHPRFFIRCWIEYRHLKNLALNKSLLKKKERYYETESRTNPYRIRSRT